MSCAMATDCGGDEGGSEGESVGELFFKQLRAACRMPR